MSAAAQQDKKLGPIIATLRSSTCIFEVKCELTGKWISPAYSTFGYNINNEEKMKVWKPRSIMPEYKHYKFKTEGDIFWITPPIGFWLVDDGRLISAAAQETHKFSNVVGYYGQKDDVLARRTIKHILDGSFTFMPVQ